MADQPVAQQRALTASAPQLITYADRLGGSIGGIAALLNGPLAGAFGGVHLLPFFSPIDGADAGFDPIDHRRVDNRIGTWDDVAQLANTHEVMADLIVNHLSDRSPEFTNWLEHGGTTDSTQIFLTMDRVFPDGATEAELLAVYRPRPGLPFTRVRRRDGSAHLMWTTFTEHQIDLDVEHPAGWAYLMSVVDQLVQHGVRWVRLDAIGYAIKRAGTSCFMIPDTFEFIDRLTKVLRAHGVQTLVEVHGHHEMQVAVASRVDLVYDFALPPLILDALYRRDANILRQWLRIRPNNAINVLDTHDGIGVIDVGPDPTRPGTLGLLDTAQLQELVENIHRHSDGASRLATGAAASNLDLYQVNCTYFDALGRDPSRYLLARLIQFLVPGIPQVYYVGLLAGTNDVDLLERTGVGRDINRHHYAADEVAAALETPLVQALLAMLRWRATTDVFEGDFTLLDSPPQMLALRWDSPEGDITGLRAEIDLATLGFEIVESTVAGERTITGFNGF
jgi:sucrose phosphorylase